jgi:thiamine pyrophosphate-dependent acetolactate synthase large subunit-like protein
MNDIASQVHIDRPVGLKPGPGRWGSDYLAEVMRLLRVEHVVLVPGASFRGLHDSLVNHLGNRDPSMLLTLHEETAVAIAHGYAKVTGRPLGVILHSNVGLMHGTMAIFNAFCDRMPMLIYGATGPMDAHARRPWIDWIHTCTDQAALIRHFIKWDNQPASLQAAAEAMLRAAQIATTVPCGPTYIVFDSALQEAPMQAKPALPDVARYAPSEPPHPSPQALSAAVKLLCAAKRPLLLPGRLGRSVGAWNDRIELAELTGARVLTDLKTAASFPSDHPLHAGLVKYITDESKAVFQDADLIVSLDWIDLAGSLRQVWKDAPVPAKIIQISADALVHNGWSMDHQGLPPADLNILADPDATTRALVAALRKSRRKRPAAARKRPSAPGPRPTLRTGAPEATAKASGGEEIGVRALADAVLEVAAQQDTCLIKVNIGWPAQGTRFNHPLDFLGNDGGGGVGSGIGISIGAALALRGSGRLPLAVLGDGDFMMGVSGLWTATRHGIPLLVVVANNLSFFNDEMHQERMALQRGRPTENRWIGQRIAGPDLDIAALAKAQGAIGIGPIGRRSELRKALKSAASQTLKGNVAVIDVRVAAEYDAPLATLMVRGEK